MASEPWTIQRVLSWTQGRFGERGKETPRLDAEVLLAHVLGRDRVYLYTHFDQPLMETELAAFRELVRRRLAGEPVAYLVGRREFRLLELHLDARVLVPRPDTETLVETVLARLAERAAPAARLVDVGTGSGAIALALKKALPETEVIGVDISPDALPVAQANGERLGLAVRFVVGDLLAGLEGAFDAVVANPPYVPSGDLARLSAEVQREPLLALDGGVDGLDVVRRLIPQARALLAPRGLFAVEIGQGQAAATASLMTRAGFVEVRLTRDLGNVERVVSALRPA